MREGLINMSFTLKEDNNLKCIYCKYTFSSVAANCRAGIFEVWVQFSGIKNVKTNHNFTESLAKNDQISPQKESIMKFFCVISHKEIENIKSMSFF